jgi:acyl-CoA thioesterase-1
MTNTRNGCGHRLNFRHVFGLLAFLGALSAAGIALAEEPTSAKWKYSAELMRPFWVGDTVQGESVLFVRNPETGEATASVLFPVRGVVHIRNASGDVTYEEGRDYSWKSAEREISLPRNSRIVSHTPDELRRPAGSQKYKLTHRDGNGEIFFGGKLEYHQMQTTITYAHHVQAWPTRLPHFDEKTLPRSIGRLRGKQPLSIVLLGDSISSGCNASGWAGGAPFQPSFDGLLEQHLATRYETQVKLTNLSISGKDTRWAQEAIDQVLEPRPDLVILAFGMNDAAGRTAQEYQANTLAIITKIRQRKPDTEFILVATMLGNRDWTTLKHELFPQYLEALENLREPGVALADMTSIWAEFLKRKRDWDLTGNGVNHPNDFGHRVYAQVLSTLLVNP